MTEECNDIPIGISLSMSIYAVCIYVLDKLVQMYKIDNRIVFIIYFVPLIILYIEVPNLLRKSDKWQKYME